MVHIMYATYYLFYDGTICKEGNAAFYFLMACILFTKILKTMQYLKAVKMSFSTIKKSHMKRNHVLF